MDRCINITAVDVWRLLLILWYMNDVELLKYAVLSEFSAGWFAIENASNKILSPNIIWAAKLFPFNLPKNTFDFITSMESLEHVKDFEAFFWVLSQSLKIGGTLFISSPHEKIMPYNGYIWHYKHFLPEEIRDLAKSNNLIEINSFSTNSSILKDGKSCLFYPFQISNDQPVELNKGDTLFFEFRKN